MIKDSGARTEFPSGAVRDLGGEDKGRCDLMPLDVIAEIYGNHSEDMRCDPADIESVFCGIHDFQQSGDYKYLIEALAWFDTFGEEWEDMFLEVSKHFAAGCEKYGENNWKKGIPLKSYINSGVRHYLKWLRGDDDEPHDRAFVWNIMCAIWTCKHKPELNEYGLKECPVCGEQLPAEAVFCDNCKANVGKPENKCVVCGAPIPAKWKYCDTCWENKHGG